MKIDQTKVIRYEGALPDDAQHKGYRTVVVQGIIIKTNNIAYQLECYYSPSERKTYEAPLLDDVDGEFSADLNPGCFSGIFSSRISEEKIHQMLADIGIRISAGEISNIITKDHDGFHKEKADINVLH